MGLNMWLKDDLRSVLQGVALAAPYMGSERAPAAAEAFRAGWLAALASVALTLGIADLPAHTLRELAQEHQARLT